MSKPTLADEKRAEFVLRDWQRSHDFNMRLHVANPTERNREAMQASKDQMLMAKVELMRIQRARRPVRELVPA